MWEDYIKHMVEQLYLTDPYLKEFEAVVVQAEGKFVVLDKTAFYPSSGGQPFDTGKIVRLPDKKEFPVVFVGVVDGSLPRNGADSSGQTVINHEVGLEGLKAGDRVSGMIDWERRYRLMRMHTAAHIILKYFFDKFNALVTGNQLDTDRSRIDFSMETFDFSRLKEYEKEINEIIQKDMPVSFRFVSSEEARDPELFKLAKGHAGRERMRIVYIGEYDRQADGGCHVRRTGEIGRVIFVDFVNKGKNNRRVYYTIE